MAVQSLKNLHTFILKQPCWWAKPSNILENPPTSVDNNSLFIGPNNFKFGTETSCIVLRYDYTMQFISYMMRFIGYDSIQTC